MKREISFVAQELHGNNWVYGWPYKKEGNVYIQTEYGELVQVKPNSINEYTGCSDKNGRRIYENDRLCVRIWKNGRNAEPYEYYTSPVFEDGSFVIHGENGALDTYLAAYCLCSRTKVEIEVVRHDL